MPIPVISQVIKERRLELKLPMEKIADGLGVNRSTVCRWEKGEINGLKRAHIYLLSKILYLPVEMLLGCAKDDEKAEDAEMVKLKIRITDELDLVKDKESLEQLEKYLKLFIIK